MVYQVVINSTPGFDEWREYARFCLANKIAPEQVCFYTQAPNTLLLMEPLSIEQVKNLESSITLPKGVVERLKSAACHHNSNRFNFLYKILWRLVYENKKLLAYQTDDDVIMLNKMIKAVHRDAYKIKAFLRFRELKNDDNMSVYVAYYEPEHYSLALVLSFFKTRFKNMNWSIITPYVGIYWDQEQLTFSNNLGKEHFPKEDEVEDYWLKYYASIFNPARVKTKAMLSQMPKKYWGNLPEAKIIPELLEEAPARLQKMLEQLQSL